MDRVISYIHADLSASLDNDTLAEVAHLSSYHWHRIYRAITGETAAATVRRARLHRAASELLRTDTSIGEIGASVGYPEIHSFTRTFKSYYGIAPGRFRQDKTVVPENQPDKANIRLNHPIEIVEQPPMQLVGLEHYGDYLKIGATFERAMAMCAMEGIDVEFNQSVGIYFDDPECVDEMKLRSFAGMPLSNHVTVAKPLTTYHVERGRYAMLIHTGPYARLEQSYLWLYAKWLPESGLAVRDAPCCERYLNSPLDTPQHELRTAICLPIE